MPQIDTKIGGEAGMAGVGRRGFAAAVRAAVFLAPQPPRERRDNAPQFLDIAAARSCMFHLPYYFSFFAHCALQ